MRDLAAQEDRSDESKRIYRCLYIEIFLCSTQKNIPFLVTNDFRMDNNGFTTFV